MKKKCWLVLEASNEEVLPQGVEGGWPISPWRGKWRKRSSMWEHHDHKESLPEKIHWRHLPKEGMTTLTKEEKDHKTLDTYEGLGDMKDAGKWFHSMKMSWWKIHPTKSSFNVEAISGWSHEGLLDQSMGIFGEKASWTFIVTEYFWQMNKEIFWAFDLVSAFWGILWEGQGPPSSQDSPIHVLLLCECVWIL